MIQMQVYLHVHKQRPDYGPGCETDKKDEGHEKNCGSSPAEAFLGNRIA